MTLEDGIVGVFSRAAGTYDRIGPRFFAHFGQRLVERVHLTPGAEVLDVAAGRGAVRMGYVGGSNGSRHRYSPR